MEVCKRDNRKIAWRKGVITFALWNLNENFWRKLFRVRKTLFSVILCLISFYWRLIWNFLWYFKLAEFVQWKYIPNMPRFIEFLQNYWVIQKELCLYAKVVTFLEKCVVRCENLIKFHQRLLLFWRPRKLVDFRGSEAWKRKCNKRHNDFEHWMQISRLLVMVRTWNFISLF